MSKAYLGCDRNILPFPTTFACQGSDATIPNLSYQNTTSILTHKHPAELHGNRYRSTYFFEKFRAKYKEPTHTHIIKKIEKNPKRELPLILVKIDFRQLDYCC